MQKFRHNLVDLKFSQLSVCKSKPQNHIQGRLSHLFDDVDWVVKQGWQKFCMRLMTRTIDRKYVKENRNLPQ